ncbi:MAG: tetratricopeptide repeat protein [Alphaproteobacteria bacterium]|nr:tetratricopeptide repeat protein [Alphaproteobacteria bacterium]
MNVKKLGITIIVLACVGAIGVGGWQMYKQSQSTKDRAELPLVWVTDKPAPKTVEPGAYLAALNAIFNDDLDKAAAFYLKVLNGDPENTKLQREGYFFNAILGNFETLRPIVERLSQTSSPEFLTEYVRAAYAVQDNDWGRARESVKDRHYSTMDRVLAPLIRAWTYVGEKNAKDAMAELEKIKELPAMVAYYSYHKGLMGLALGDKVLADSGFQEMAANKLLTVSFYPEIRAFYMQQGKWNIENPMYVQWQLFASEQPATAELIMSASPRLMSANRGIGEAFYNVSTALGSNKSNYESALILSAASLYLNKVQELPKIWSAEVLEQVGKPQLAAHYYDQLPDKITQTLAFKKATNLIACGRDQEALVLLNKLKVSNRDSTHLWLALAGIYQKKQNWPAAIQAYTRVLEIEGESNREYAADIYFARSFMYQENKQNKLAESDLKQALVLNPNNALVLNQLGYQWLEQDATLDEGFKLVEKAYQLKGADPHILDSMAYAFYRKADYQKALPLAEKTVDVMPQSSVANAHLGDIYAAMGRSREAQFQYHKALSLSYDLTPTLKASLTQKMAITRANKGQK